MRNREALHGDGTGTVEQSNRRPFGIMIWLRTSQRREDGKYEHTGNHLLLNVHPPNHGQI
jgi:hypothetical protein